VLAFLKENKRNSRFAGGTKPFLEVDPFSGTVVKDHRVKETERRRHVATRQGNVAATLEGERASYSDWVRGRSSRSQSSFHFTSKYVFFFKKRKRESSSHKSHRTVFGDEKDSESETTLLRCNNYNRAVG
jgi:hypothetical protein